MFLNCPQLKSSLCFYPPRHGLTRIHLWKNYFLPSSRQTPAFQAATLNLRSKSGGEKRTLLAIKQRACFKSIKREERIRALHVLTWTPRATTTTADFWEPGGGAAFRPRCPPLGAAKLTPVVLNVWPLRGRVEAPQRWKKPRVNAKRPQNGKRRRSESRAKNGHL